jgi:hypothetical protein
VQLAANINIRDMTLFSGSLADRGHAFAGLKRGYARQTIIVLRVLTGQVKTIPQCATEGINLAARAPRTNGLAFESVLKMSL